MNERNLLIEARRIIEEYRHYGEHMRKYGRGFTTDVEPGQDGTFIIRLLDDAIAKDEVADHAEGCPALQAWDIPGSCNCA